MEDFAFTLITSRTTMAHKCHMANHMTCTFNKKGVNKHVTSDCGSGSVHLIVDLKVRGTKMRVVLAFARI